MTPARATRRIVRLIDPDLDSEVFLAAKIFVLCGLPYKSTTTSVTRRARTGRDSFLEVTYTPIEHAIGLPYGTDRALLAFVQRMAFETGTMELAEVKQFFDAFGLSATGREYNLIAGRFRRLANLAITISMSGRTQTDRINLTPIRRITEPTTYSSDTLAALPESTGQLTLLPPPRFAVTLDPAFHAYLKNNPVPLPLKLMRVFHQSPVEWDFAQWVTWRAIAANKDSLIPFTEILEQLGAARSHPLRLRSQYSGVLAQIRLLYPEFETHFLRGLQGLQVRPWKPPTNT